MKECSENLEHSGRNRVADFLQLLALANVTFILMIVVFATLGFLLDVRLSAFLLLLSAITTLVILLVFTSSWRATLLVVAAAGAAHLVAYFVAVAFFESSWDGLAYHQEAVLRLASGWNPLFQKANQAWIDQVWIDHYPKGSWIAGATVFLASGQLEAGKLFNFTLILAAGAEVASALLYLTALRLVAVTLIALASALNPVAVYQAVTFCVDGATASLFTMIFAGLIIYVRCLRWHALVVPLFAACVLINLKFTGLIYAAILLLTALLVVWQQHGFRAARKFGCVATLTGAIALLALGYSPYVRNLRENGHPFYPLMGRGKIDIMTQIRPVNLVGKDRFARFVIVNFSRSEVVRPPRATTFKFPLWVESVERSAFGSVHPEAGGFGPFYGALLLMSGAGLCLLFKTTKIRHVPVLCLIAGCLFLTIFVHADGWWARYAPQAWLIPMAVIVCLLMVPRVGYLWLGRTMLALVIANVLFVGLCYGRHEWGYSRRVRNDLREMSSVPRPVTVYLGRFQSLQERLRERHVNFKLILTPPDSTATTGWHHLVSPSSDALWRG